MNKETYLERIGLSGSDLTNDLESLRRLQHAHLLSVPFENLDIHWKRHIVPDIDRFYSKIVGERRGGFCYELNGLFNELLKALGFQTRLISARVSKGGTPGREYDHAAIIVTLGDDEYLVDVGFGDFTTGPLRFVVDEVQSDAAGEFMLRRYDDEYFEVAKLGDETWNSEYVFKDIPRELNEFSEMCDFQQYSPESHFTKGKLCSVLTVDGRKTISDTKFIVHAGGDMKVEDIASNEEFERILADEFNITPLQ